MAETEVFFVMSLLVPEGTDEEVVRNNLRKLPIANPFRVLPEDEARAWRTSQRVDPLAHYKALTCCRELFRLLARSEGANTQEMARADGLLGELAENLWQALTPEERAEGAPEELPEEAVLEEELES